MKQIAKKRNIIIAILISFALMAGAFFGIFFSLNKQTVQAETYTYGTFNPNGYYSLDDVVFYAVKVKASTIEATEMNEYLKYVTGISNSQFRINNVVYTINGNEEGNGTITDGINTFQILSNYFRLGNVEYKIVGTSIYRTSFVAGITDSSFTLNSITYTINGNSLTYTSGSYPITNGYFEINGIQYELNSTEPPSKVYQVAYNYWPTYEIVTEDLTNDGEENPTPVFIKFGETVLLNTDESILICYARQTASTSSDNIYIMNGVETLSATVDFLTGNIVVNGVEKTNDISNSTTTGGVQNQEFGYILNLNDTEIAGKDQLGLLGIANGASNEGLIEFSSNYQIGSSVKEFSFMFYAFKKATYERVEDLNNDPSEHFDRPAPAIKANDSILEHVTDSATANIYFAEAFYYYSNQNLPYLEFDYMRYEVAIAKTIHTVTTTYIFSYDPIEGEILQEISNNSGKASVYSQYLRVEKIDGTTKAKVYFEDLGVYELLYKGIYYGESGKVELATLNQDTRQDKLTIYGTQATYQDTTNGQTSFRNEDNTISADITGINGISFDGDTLTISEGFQIASTNQPQVKFLFNSTVTGFSVYYSETKNGTYTQDSTYSYTSNFTTPGFYYIVATNQYSKYKISTGTNSPSYSSTTSKTQNYLFEISNKAPSLYIYQLDDNKNIVTSNPTRIYSGTYTKNGVQVIEIEEGSVFDSEISLTLEFRTFVQTEMTKINLPTNFDKLTSSEQSEAITYLAGYGITKHDGYYKFTTDGYYSLNLNGAKCAFYVDTQSISGIQVYDVENLNGSYYNATLLAEQDTFATTNKAISLFWGTKASGAQITAKYMRFDLDSTDYLSALNSTIAGNYIDNDYILNGNWLAADYSIILSGSNTETIYNKASNTSLITSNSVLSLDGLYIFKLQDEAGNVAYYPILIDTSIPTVLQTTEYGVNYNKITGVNNVSEPTKIFFGTDKAISFLLNDKLVASNSSELNSLKTSAPIFKEYFESLFENLGDFGAENLIQTDIATNYYYVTVPISKVTMKIVNGKSEDLTSTDLANGYTILEPSLNDNGKIADKTYIYQIYDGSNRTIAPTRAYTIRVNTDNTGVLILDENGNDLTSYNTKTAEDFTSMTNYYIPTETNKLYLTWSNLHHEETLGGYVDIYNDGLVCYYYELIWDSTLNSYKYSATGTKINLDFSSITPELERDGETVRIPVNFSSAGTTYAGMYEIIRTYTFVSDGIILVSNNEFTIGNVNYYIRDSKVYKESDDSLVENVIGGQFTLRDMIYTLDDISSPTQLTYSGSNNTLGNDYEEVKTTVFVDRNKIISSASVNGEQTGYYTYMKLFDGGASENVIYYDSLYQQSQSSNNFTIQTNKLPVGFYIPISKYGTTYEFDNDIQGAVLNKSAIQGRSSNTYRYINLVEFYDLDTSSEAGTLNSVYSPYELTVTLISPTGVYYYYSYNATNGYFLISGYSLDAGKTIVSIDDYKAYINLSNNPKTGSYVWETGTYKLLINAVDKQNNDATSSQYLQSFYFLFDVVTNTPSSNLKAEYPDLNNMDPRDILVGDLNYYYTNTNQIKVNWTESSYNYLTKIDLTTIQYKYYIGSNITTEIVLETDVLTNVNDKSFIITVPTNAEKIVITMSYEVYSSDTTSVYRKYYPVGAYKSEKTIIIDRSAPVASISTLTSSDQTVKNVSPSLLRASLNLSGESLDTRFNKTITTGLYKYYAFMSSTDFVSSLSSRLLINGSKETKYFYYKYFPEKYSSKYETGLALDSSASPTNVFRESYASSDGWTKVASSVDANYLANNFTYVGYYEVIEVDLAGNMTIYTIYISNGSTLNIDFTQKLSANTTDGKLELSKVNNNTLVKLTQNGIATNYTNPTSIDINSYDSFNFKNINFGTVSYTIGATQYDISYKFLKIMINNVIYLVTPFGFESGTCTKVMNSSGALVSLSDLLLGYNNGKQNSISIYDTVNGKTYSVNVKVSKADARITDSDNGSAYIKSNDTVLSSLIKQDNVNAESRTLALIIKENDGAALKLEASSLLIYEINSSLTNGYKKYEYSNTATNQILRKQVANSSLGYTTYYYYIVYNEATFNTSTFYVVFKDDFGNEYIDNYTQYNTTMPNRYEYYDGNDLTSEMQTSDNILVSKDIGVNISNLRTTVIKAKIGQATEYSEIDKENGAYCTTYNDTGASYTQYRLKALTTSANGYSGGLIEFQIELSLSIPEEILDELAITFETISSESDVLKTMKVSIYNQLPIISASNNDGTDITTALFNKEITQSEPVTLSFGTGNDLSEELGFTSKVFVRLRGATSGYYEITSPKTISAPGIYDVYVQNFNSNGSLDYIKSYDFVISDLNLIFYAVVKTNTDNTTEVVSSTGKVFSYTSGASVVYVPYHYILNTSNYEIKTNSNKVTYTVKDVDNSTGTTIYEITSTSGTIFRTTIAVTVVSSTNNILGTNSFVWYLGTTYTSPTVDNYIKSTSKDIFLAKEDNYDEITLIWNSYYSNVYNKITCSISSDDGETWSTVKGIDNGEKTTLTLKKSSVYLFKFVDYAGNIQTFTSTSGYPSMTTKVTFIRSVIYKLNGNNPLDNSIYNGTVEISLPTSTSTYYSSTPTMVAMRNNLEYTPTRDKDGNYVFTESGTYVIYFSVKVKNGTKNLNEDNLTFTIINPNDSRWAFNYANYNNYNINYVKYNGVNISTSLKDYALSGNEINISAFLQDSLGNKYFSNGVYTIKMTSIDDALGTQSFEFNFWLNDAVPPITVSLAEGASTTGNVTVSFNEANLYETIGDCYIMINDKLYATITSSSTGVNSKNITGVGYHYIQVYTNSGKLAYSYRVQITEPLNTITIILIVVACVVVAVGALLFFLLRKKMRVR